ncbi:MAG: phosphate signaling complex protein PhoU [Chloroflexi bacterium]|nr:phosphate signaling complex protein PhoU [Chloroflexota bacterium]
MPDNVILSSRGSLDRELTSLRDNVLRLSTVVDVAIQQSIHALKRQIIDLARQVVADDAKVNRLRYQVEEEAYTLIARQQPNARDLRCIIAAIHLAIELERIGDHAANIATLSFELSREALLKPLVDIPRMADISRSMLQDSMNAYVQWDVDRAKATIAQDQEINALDRQVYRELITYMLEDPSKINRATHMLWVSHNLERIGDRVTNVCERIIYMVTGEVFTSNQDHTEGVLFSSPHSDRID